MKLFSAAILLLVGSTTTIAAAPTVENLFPPGGQRGTTVAVKATGKFSSGTLSAWCSRDGIAVTATGKKSSSRTLSIKIPKDAEPGLCWIRLFNAEGASALRPFFVGTIAEATEREPNDRRTDSIAVLSKPTTVNGILAKSRDVDNYAIVLKKGQTLVAAMTANNSLGSPMDGILQVVSEQGFILAQNDDHEGFDPRVVFVAPAAGKYYVRTFAFPAMPNSTVRFAGGSNYIYRLTISAGPYIDYAYPLAVRRSATDPVQLHGWNLPAALKQFAVSGPPDADSATIVSPLLSNTATVQRVDVDTFTEETWTASNRKKVGDAPAVVTGRLSLPGETDRYRFRAKKGARLTVSVASRDLGFPTDPVLRVADAKGKTIKRVETRSSTKIDESLPLTISADGEYVAEVSDLHGRGGDRFVYRLSILESKPGFELSLKADAFVLTAGKPLSIPVTITRERGFRGEIEIKAAGLPPGVSAKPVTSQKSGATAKAVKLELTVKGKPAAASNGTFRIIGTVKGAPEEKPARAPITGLTDKTPDLWLTVTAGKASKTKTAKSKSKKK